MAQRIRQNNVRTRRVLIAVALYVLAIALCYLGLLYGEGRVNLFAAHPGWHHITHLLVCWVLAFLCGAGAIVATVSVFLTRAS
jgi:hypothetical protein